MRRIASGFVIAGVTVTCVSAPAEPSPFSAMRRSPEVLKLFTYRLLLPSWVSPCAPNGGNMLPAAGLSRSSVTRILSAPFGSTTYTRPRNACHQDPQRAVRIHHVHAAEERVGDVDIALAVGREVLADRLALIRQHG